MDFRQLRVVQVPRTVKLLVLALLLLQVLVGIACAAAVATRWLPEHDAALLPAAAYALAAGIPFFALALVLTTSRSGPKAWDARIAHILLKLVPRQLARIDLGDHDPSEGLVRFHGRQVPVSRAQLQASEVTVDLRLASHGSAAFYRIQANHTGKLLVLWMSIDLTPRQATVTFSAPQSRVDRGHFARSIPGTLQGALVSGGYSVDEIERTDTRDGAVMTTVILRRRFEADDVLWDPAENHLFTTDLALMVTEVLREGHALLGTPASGKSAG